MFKTKTIHTMICETCGYEANESEFTISIKNTTGDQAVFDVVITVELECPSCKDKMKYCMF